MNQATSFPCRPAKGATRRYQEENVISFEKSNGALKSSKLPLCLIRLRNCIDYHIDWKFIRHSIEVN